MPLTIHGPEGRSLKLTYSEQTVDSDGQICPPEVQLKLHDCFSLPEHPRIAEGKVAVKLWLCAPDGKRLKPTCNWPEFKAKEYPQLKPVLQKKFPGVAWH